MNTIAEIFLECKKIIQDGNYSYAKNWKKEDPKRVLIGIIPNYFPREIIHAANGLAVSITGSDYRNPILKEKDDQTIESCSMLGGVFELVQNEVHEEFDGFILPSHCKALQSFDEIVEINKKSRFVKYINFPQYFQTIIGDIINHFFVQSVLDEIYKINGVKITIDMLNNSIQLFKNNLKLTEKFYDLRKKYSDKISSEDLFYVVFSGYLLPIEKHNEILNNIIELLVAPEDKDDNIYKVYSGVYC